MPSIFQMAFLTGFILVIDETKLLAQFQSSKYEVGINAGTLIYQGDLTPSYTGNYKTIRPALGFSLSRSLGKHLAVGANLNLGNLVADEARYLDPQWRQDRSFSFKANLTEVSTVLIWYLNKSTYYYQPRFTPYIYAGAGLTFLHIRKDWSKVNTEVYDAESTVQTGLAVDTLQPAHKVLAVMPLGIGIKYRFAPQLSFNAGITYRFTASDYIDGFKYSGNAGKNDSYYGLSLGLFYTFGSYKCPPVK